MNQDPLDQELARWRVEPAGSDALARAVRPPGRLDPVLMLPVAFGALILVGAVIGWQANARDNAEMLELHARELAAILRG